MTVKTVNNLIKMANEIAANFSFHEDTVDRVADHLSRFWAPSMKNNLHDYLKQGGAGLVPEVVTALQQIMGD